MFTCLRLNYHNDIQFWCATDVDQDGIVKRSGANKWSSSTWGWCSSDCPIHEQNWRKEVTWTKDETVKMTLQYYNPVLWAGLEFYGFLLACLLLYSLILTALISATGTITVTISYNCSYLFQS